MPEPEPFLIFTRKLGELRLPHMVSGSVASIFYGEPRLTNDVDIILDLKPEAVARLQAAFPAKEFYCPPADVILVELAREARGHFNLIHHRSGFKADIYLRGEDPLHVWGLARARIVSLGQDVLSLAPPEYVILRKLQFYREGRSAKHLRDIRRMLASLGEGWDRKSLETLIDEQGLQAEWQAAQSETGS